MALSKRETGRLPEERTPLELPSPQEERLDDGR
jgi:hypothetical protein